MLLRHLLLCALVGLTFTFTSALSANAAPTYTLQDLGPLPFVADDVAPSLNDAGEVSFWCSGPAAVQGAIWSKGKIQPLGSAAGYPSSVAHALNANGEAAGWTSTSTNSVDSRAVTRAAVWHKNVLTVLGTLGGRDSQAFGINSGGINSESTIVGVSQCTDGTRHAFAASGGKLRDLGALPGGDFSQAYAVNKIGQIVGVSNSSKEPYKHAVCWRGGQIQDLGLLPGGTSSSARAINSHDQIAGYADTPNGTHAFLYTQGKMLDLGTLGADPSNAAALNDQGQVVGAAGFAADQHHAFLWQDGKMFDLNKLTTAGSAWILLQADAINNRGQIVCMGRHKGGQVHALLLTPATVGRPVTERTH